MSPPRASPPHTYALALAIATSTLAACGPPQEPSGRPPPNRPAPSPPLQDPTAGAPADKPPPAPAPPFAERVAAAYAMRARGDTTGAASAFDSIVRDLVALGTPVKQGFSDIEGEVVQGRSHAALTMSAPTRGTLFFDLATGEPWAYFADIHLRAPSPPLDGSYFVTSPPSLFDPVRAQTASLQGDLIAVHPDGHRAYTLGSDCRIREISIEKGDTLRTLSPHTPKRAPAEDTTPPECQSSTFDDAAITADGNWLSTRVGRFRLATGTHARLPFPVRSGDYAPAISPDGKYAARVVTVPALPGSELPRSAVQLVDLATGAVKATSPPISVLSNGDPLSFADSPMRVCVFDYGFHAFEVPSMKAFTPGQPPMSNVPDKGPPSFSPSTCTTAFVRPPPAHPDLRARLAARVCAAGRFLIPVAHCALP
ncbi:MAG: hypothetical protein R3B70_17935 [Polyangiaceae bacterium]